MKRPVTILASVLCLVALSLSTIPAQAADCGSNVQLKMSTPASPLSSNSFNVQYSVLSITPANFTVNLYQDGDSNLVGSQNTSSDPNGVNGNSGAFAVTAADGHHSFHLVATRTSDSCTKATDVSVDVNGTAPAAPSYLGKIRSGNSYTVKFTAPSDSDVKEVRIYSSTSTTFTANGATQVGTVSVSPGQTTSFTYTASSSAERYNAVRAFDVAGNGSAAVGDPNIVVTTTTVGGAGGGGANVATAAGAAGAGNAAGTGTTTPATAEGQTLGTSTTNKSTTDKKSTDKNSDKKGSVLGTETTKENNDGTIWSSIIALLVIVAVVYWFAFRGGKNPFKRS